MNFQIINFLIVVATILLALYQAVRLGRSGTILVVEVFLIVEISSLIWHGSSNTLLGGIAAIQIFYLFEMAQQLRLFVLRGILYQILLGLVLVCAGVELVLLLQASLYGWLSILAWALLIGSCAILVIHPIRVFIAQTKHTHWLGKRGKN